MIDLLAATAIAMAHPPTGTVGTDV